MKTYVLGKRRRRFTDRQIREDRKLRGFHAKQERIARDNVVAIPQTTAQEKAA